MLSAFPATDSLVGNPFPPFEPGFTPWEYHEPPFLFPPLSPQQQEPVVFSPQPVSPNSDSGTPTPPPNSGSKLEPVWAESKNTKSGSDEPKRNINSKNLGSNSNSVTDERKRKRMISNRESARRSRLRKMTHLENMRNQVNRLKVGNREIMNRLRLVVHQSRLVHTENECLRSEAEMLRQRLSDIRQILHVRQFQQHLKPSAWPCIINNNVAPQGHDHQLLLHSLIT